LDRYPANIKPPLDFTPVHGELIVFAGMRVSEVFGLRRGRADAALVEYRALMEPSWFFGQIRRMMRGRRAGRLRKP
jgi:hypothetical protein